MGIDLLDLTVRIEEEFKVELDMDFWYDIIRDRDVVASDLYSHLLIKMHRSEYVRNDIRLNFDFWSEFQQIIQDVTELPREQIQLKSSLEQLFPKKTRYTVWQNLRDKCPYRVPDLDYPAFIRYASFCLALLAVGIEQLQFWRGQGMNFGFWLILGVAGILMFLETYTRLLSFLRPWRYRLPSGCTNVKDLCRLILSTDYEVICRGAYIPMNDRCLQVWSRLKKILVEMSYLKGQQVTFSSRLFADLGMD